MTLTVKDMIAAARTAVPGVTPAEAKALIAAGALVVDVREAQEIAATGKVAGALHVARGMLEFRADPATPYHDNAFMKDRTIILYCASGGRSALGAATLMAMGYSEVRDLGAFKDWAASGGAIEAALPVA